MAGKQMRAVVVGASTILGKELAEEMNDSAAVMWDIALLDESEDGEAQLTAAGDEATVIQPLTREALDGADLVFFAGDAASTREYWRYAVAAGASVVDLTGTLDGEPGFLVRSPWVEGGAKPDLTTAGVVSAHPAALMLALAVGRLLPFGLTAFSATVLEPASQAGRAGLDELHQQTVGLLSFQSVTREIFDAQIAFNLQSSLGEASRVQLSSVRAMIRRHLAAIVEPNAQASVRLEVIQAPVFHGYTVSALAEFARPARESELRHALSGGPVLAEADTVPSNLAVTESGEVLVSLRADDTEPSAYWLWMAADNLRLAARNAVAAAMELAALRPVAGVQ